MTLSKYLAAHHELICFPAEATRIAHEIGSGEQDRRLAAGMTYPYTCSPEDVWKSMQKDRELFLYRCPGKSIISI